MSYYKILIHSPFWTGFPWVNESVSCLKKRPQKCHERVKTDPHHNVFMTQDMVSLLKMVSAFMTWHTAMAWAHLVSFAVTYDGINCVNQVKDSVEYEDFNGKTLKRDEIVFAYTKDCLDYVRDKCTYHAGPTGSSFHHINMTEFCLHCWRPVFPFE